MVIVSPGEIMKVFSIFLYPKKLKTMVWFPGSKDKVYNPSKSVVVPMVVPFNWTLAKGKGALLYSLSVNKPFTFPLSCALTIDLNILCVTAVF